MHFEIHRSLRNGSAVLQVVRPNGTKSPDICHIQPDSLPNGDGNSGAELIDVYVRSLKANGHTVEDLRAPRGWSHAETSTEDSNVIGRAPAQILVDYSASTWLKDALRSALKRDRVDAINDAEALLDALKEHGNSDLDGSDDDWNANH